jgi:hypothetical protein
MIVRDDDGCRPAQQGPRIDLHGINEDVVLCTEAEEFKGVRACPGLRSGGLGVIETEESEVFSIAVQFGGTEESGLEEVEEIGGGLDVEVLGRVKTDLHMNRF